MRDILPYAVRKHFLEQRLYVVGGDGEPVPDAVVAVSLLEHVFEHGRNFREAQDVVQRVWAASVAGWAHWNPDQRVAVTRAIKPLAIAANMLPLPLFLQPPALQTARQIEKAAQNVRNRTEQLKTADCRANPNLVLVTLHLAVELRNGAVGLDSDILSQTDRGVVIDATVHASFSAATAAKRAGSRWSADERSRVADTLYRAFAALKLDTSVVNQWVQEAKILPPQQTTPATNQSHVL